MNFDFENPHTYYVIAAYGVAALGYLGIGLHTFFKSCASRKALGAVDKTR
ncbi:MAG: hypothetical protein SFW65_02250 [Alphaproteobacteria bacterium]|nr:hypothetical protein [Alphaproteobacteria bacterium]